MPKQHEQDTCTPLKKAGNFKKIFLFFIAAIMIMISLTLTVSAASYPLIIMDTWESTPTIVEGDTGVLKFTIFIEYKNERYNVQIYDSNNKLVGSASQTYYNSSGFMKTVTITVDTAALNLPVGEYKVVYWMEFYSLYQWNTAPNKYTGSFKIVEDKCNGNHNMSLKQVVSESTCEKEGTGLYSCSKCDFREYRSVPKAHNYGEWLETAAPTCTMPGMMRRECETCDAYETKEIAALGHAKVPHSAQDPTCTAIGWKKYDTCSRCSYTTYQQLSALGHNYIATVTPPGCTEQGYTTHCCSRCQVTYVDNYVDAYNSHDYVATVTPPTCTKQGYTTHDCSRCDDTYVDTYVASYGGHDYAGTVTSPTCTERGYTTHDCSRCDAQYIDTYVEATGHTFGGWVETFKPTCTEKGTERRDCDICDFYETQKINPLGHDTIPHAAQAPTCTEIGWKAYDTCSRCTYTTYKSIAATGHDYAEKITTPTCTKEGYTTHACTVCEDSYVDTPVVAKGHAYDDEYDAHCNVCDEKRDAPMHPAAIGGIVGGSAVVVGGGGTALWWFVFRKRRLI